MKRFWQYVKGNVVNLPLEVMAMDKTIKRDVSATEVAQIRAQVRGYIEEMERSNERIKKGQQEIQVLKAKTRSTLSELAELQVR